MVDEEDALDVRDLSETCCCCLGAFMLLRVATVLMASLYFHSSALEMILYEQTVEIDSTEGSSEQLDFVKPHMSPGLLRAPGVASSL